MTIELAPSESELLAARQAGLTLVQWRAREELFAAADRENVKALVAFGESIGYGTPAPLAAAIRLTLPFRILCPDNAKYGVLAGRMILSRRYRRAKKAIRNEGRSQYQGPALDVPCQLEAKVWFPRDRGDAPNFAKATHDALEGVCYINDRLLWDARWMRAGIDKRRPRAELTITPLP